jgi:hypothetical protein
MSVPAIISDISFCSWRWKLQNFFALCSIKVTVPPSPKTIARCTVSQCDSEQQVPCGTLEERNTLHYFVSWGDVALIVATKRQYFKAIFVLGLFHHFVLLFKFIYVLSGNILSSQGWVAMYGGSVVLLAAGCIEFGFRSAVPCGIQT